MKKTLFHHPAHEEGIIEVAHSFGMGELDWSRVEYVLIDPHGSMEVPPIDGLNEHLAQYGAETIHRYLAVKCDLGTAQLREALLRRLPNAVTIHFKMNRGLADPNRHSSFALPSLIERASPSVQQALLARHARGLEAVQEILSRIPEQATITLLHSTPVFRYKSATQDDVKDAESLKAYLDKICGIRGPEIHTCLITGDADGSTRGDMQLYEALQKRVDPAEFSFVENDPYVTQTGKHLTSDYMKLHPDRVSVVDWRKDLLAEGSASEGTFQLDSTRIDSTKVERIADLFAESLIELGPRVGS